MIVLRLSIFGMIILVKRMIMIVIVERIDLISFSFGRGPYLIGDLELFSLF